jgi:hypothetical protein
MNDNEQKKTWLIDKVDYILQIRLEELKSEKEAATSYSARYREVINSFERKIFASAAVAATLLTAGTLIAHVSQFIALTLLIIDLAVVLMAELLVSQHQKKTAALWFELDHKYVSAITCINQQRVILASIGSKINSVKIDQLHLLIPHTEVALGHYRVGIIRVLDQIFDNICLGYIEKSLVHLLEGQKELLNEAYETYVFEWVEFYTHEEFLSDLPLEETLYNNPLDLKATIEYTKRLNSRVGFKNCLEILLTHLICKIRIPK